MRELKIGMAVTFIDENRREHTALLTCIHGNVFGGVMSQPTVEKESTLVPGTEGTDWPCVNLMVVSQNPDCQDQYGRQTERHSSVVHQTSSSAQGFCYRFVDEKERPELRQPAVS